MSSCDMTFIATASVALATIVSVNSYMPVVVERGLKKLGLHTPDKKDS